MTLHCNLIDGEWVKGEAIPNVNPSNLKEVVGEYARATAEDASAAIAAAKAAFPAWSRSGPLERHGVLRKASDEILARKEELGKLLAREEGKSMPESIGETVRAAQIFDFFAGECLRLTGEMVPSVRPGVGVEITREAVGVVGLITPWNFPIAIPAWKIAPALAYGNTVVIKPADLVPGCTWALVDILHRAGLPKGVLNLVMGKGSVVGQAILDSSGRDRGQLHRQPGHRHPGGGGERQGDAPLPARDGGQEPAGDRRRRRPRHRGRVRGQRRLFFHRPALHRVVAADRDRGHPRQVRGGGGRAAEGAEGRRSPEGWHADRAGRGRKPAEAGRGLYRHRQGRGGRTRLGRRAAGARHRGVLPLPCPLRRRQQRDAHQPRGNLRPGGERHPGEGLRRGAGRGRTTRRSGSRPGSAPRASSTRRTSSATPRPAW